MKWVGQQIYDFISRFRNDVYLENISTGTIASGGNLGLDSNNKIVKADTEAGELTIANATDNRVVTSLGGTDLNAEANLTFSGSAFNATATSAAFTNTASFIVAADSGPGFILSNTANDSSGPVLTLRNTRGGSDASDGDGLGTISFIGNDDGTPSEQTYAQIIATSPDVSNSAEEGQLEFKVASHDGELQPGLIIDSGNVEDEVDVVLGNGSSSTTRLVGKLTHDSILTIESGSTTSFNPGNQQVSITTDSTDGLTGPKLLIQSNSDQVNGPEIQLQSSMSSNAFVASDNDRIGNILMSGFNDAGNLFTGAHDYAQIIGTIADATAGQEAGDLKLKVASYDGVLTDGLQLLGDTDADGEVDVTIASGAASTTTVSGNLQVTTVIELGHASDTTIARSAAGTVTIEGEEVITAATIFNVLGVGGWNGSTTRIKILHSDIIADDGGRPYMINDTAVGSDKLFGMTMGTLTAYATVAIPTGFKATHVMIYGICGGTCPAVEVWESQIDSIVGVSKGTGNVNTEINITDVTSSTTNYLFIQIIQGSTDYISGGYVTIAAV